MTSHHINLATLTWLDRRQLWATTNRASSLGTNAVPAYPSMLGGQGSRPSVANRHFAPSLSWFVNAAAAVFGLALASILVFLTVRFALGLAFSRLALSFDKSLAANTEGLSKLAPRTAPLCGLEPLSSSANFANLVYSLVGALDSASPYIPAYDVKTQLTTPPCWEAGTMALPLNGWASGLTTQGPNTPSFRSYLGEWRRLVDQSPASCTPQGHVQTTRSRLALSGLKAVAGASGARSFSSTNPSTPNNVNAYGFYLSTPWVF